MKIMFSKFHFWEAYCVPLVCRMRHGYRAFLGYLALALLLIFALIALEKAAALNEPKVVAAYLLLEDGSSRAISFPFSEKSSELQAVHRYNVKLRYNGATTRFWIIPDDYLASITVNGQLLPEERYSDSGRGDWKRGLIVDFKGFLRDGMNEIIFAIKDNGGAYGMNFKAIGIEHSLLRLVILAICILLALAFVFLVLRRFRVDRVIIMLILFAFAWHLISLAVRDYQSYGHDLYAFGQGHVNYIQYIVEKKALPPAHGWSYYHPPLYYLSGTGIFKFAKALKLADPYKALQLLSLVYYWIFLGYSMRFMAQVIKRPWTYKVAVALLLFWPAGSLAALRIGNDALLYPLFMISLFYGHRWVVAEKGRDLLLASIACGIGFFAKISIFPLGVLLGCLVLWRLYRKYATLTLRYAVTALVILSGSFFFSAADKWVYEFKAHHPEWYMAPFYCVYARPIMLNSPTALQNRLIDFVVPDTKVWFGASFTNPWHDDMTARSNFWNYMGKTAMFGEFTYSDKFRENYLAPVMNVCFALLFILACYGLPLFWRRRLIPYSHSLESLPVLLPHENAAERGYIRSLGRRMGKARRISRETDLRFVLVIAILLLFLCICARMSISAAPLNDFRYMLQILPVIVLAVTGGLERLQGHRWRFIFANIVILCFALASMLFYFGL